MLDLIVLAGQAASTLLLFYGAFLVMLVSLPTPAWQAHAARAS